MLSYLNEKVNARLWGDIEKLMQQKNISWDELTTLYNEQASELDRLIHDEFTFKSLLETGEITLIELNTIMFILDHKLLLSNAPLSDNDKQQAIEWSQK
jgi:hypothetical protein